MKLVPLKSEAVIAKENMILERAQELILNGWCQSGFAQTELGEDVWPDEEDAVSFCATGAIIRAMFELKIGVTPVGRNDLDVDFNNPYYINICQRVVKAIGHITDQDPDLLFDENRTVQVWNDLLMQSAEDVALVFKHALHDA